MKKLVIPIIALLWMSASAFTQDKSHKELKGDKYFTSYSFDKAIVEYKHSKNLTLDGQRKLAKSYHNLDQNIQAEVVYAKLTAAPEGVTAEDDYNYAMVLKSNGKYDQANTWLDKFRALKPDDLRAKSYTNNSIQLSKLQTDQGVYSILHLDVNTNAEDFAPAYYKDKIVFASTRERPHFIERRYNWNRKPFLDMYVSDIDKGQLKKPHNFSTKLNGIRHDGPASFNADGTYMAYTRNDYNTKKKDKTMQLDIYFSTFKDGKWSDPEPFRMNSATYSVGQPCLSADGNTMYFTSDMPGGYGGADLYRVNKDPKGEWGLAQNLGSKINTEGDEMFPYIEAKNGVLYFASNGRFGIGGMDIFLCATNGDAFGPVVNAGSPINTPADDFGAIVNDQLKTGYFSSDRVGGSGSDDIYSFEIMKDMGIGKKIRGIAKDKNGTPLMNTFVSLLDDKGVMVDTVTTKEGGAYTFLAPSDKTFKLTGTKKGFSEGDTTVSTSGTAFIVKGNVTLMPEETPIVKDNGMKVGDDLGKLVKNKPAEPLKTVKPVKGKTSRNPSDEIAYFDLDKYNIRPDAEVELDKIVKIMNDNPEMLVELGSYTDCRAGAEYNQVLSDKRAKASADYIKAKITKPERIYGKGYGKARPVNGCSCDGVNDNTSDCSERDHQKNRRTEFIIVKEIVSDQK
jgi:outer membrane protein OmpA-like peptidoglycan-associated protein